MRLDKLKKIREENGFTQKDIAEILKIPLKTYKNYEQGIRSIKIQMLKQLAVMFKCLVDDLI